MSQPNRQQSPPEPTPEPTHLELARAAMDDAKNGVEALRTNLPAGPETRVLDQVGVLAIAVDHILASMEPEVAAPPDDDEPTQQD